LNVTVSYKTVNGTATSGNDYVAASGNFTIPAFSVVCNFCLPFILFFCVMFSPHSHFFYYYLLLYLQQATLYITTIRSNSNYLISNFSIVIFSPTIATLTNNSYANLTLIYSPNSKHINSGAIAGGDWWGGVCIQTNFFKYNII
jgi:hypothetical protein